MDWDLGRIKTFRKDEIAQREVVNEVRGAPDWGLERGGIQDSQKKGSTGRKIGFSRIPRK